MFEVEGKTYTLKFNEKKMDVIERTADVSLMSEFNKTNGLISMGLLRVMFTTALLDDETGNPVKGQKAIDIFDKVKETNGYQGLTNATLNQFTEDMGFLFR